MNAIIGTEIQTVVHVPRNLRRGRTVRMDVLDHHRSLRSAITLPQFQSIAPITGLEKQRAVHVHQF